MKTTVNFMFLSIVVFAPFASTSGQSFQGLGDLPGGGYESQALAVSTDGLVVVGSSQSSSGTEAFRWKNGVMAGLGDLEGGTFESQAFGVSGDGSVVAGSGRSTSGQESFRWENGAMEGLGFLPGGVTLSNTKDISADGSTIVGNGRMSSTQEVAYRWEAGVMTGYLWSNHTCSVALSVSSDGSVFVGYAHNNTVVNEEAIRWENGSKTYLGDLSGGILSSAAFGTSPDGLVVVGYGNSASGYEAMRWENNIMEGLGYLPGGTMSVALATSVGGLIVVGYDTIDSEHKAFIWDQDNGMRSLHSVLVNEYGLDLTDWTLLEATDISDDNSTIVGKGINPSGQNEGWIAHIRKTLFVDADAAPGGNGESWSTAYNDLQNALDKAEKLGGVVKEIHVAEGIYRPSEPIEQTDPRTACFELMKGLSILGGYAGLGELDPNARNIDVYETILSGDLNGDDNSIIDPCDLLNDPYRAENSYHVVFSSNIDDSTLLEGFTITAGNANGSTNPENFGGGMYIIGGNPVITHCTFNYNIASRGGGVYMKDSDANINLSTFAINYADGYGAGLQVINGAPVLFKCTFNNNDNPLSGGGAMHIDEITHTSIENCIIFENDAKYGGGIVFSNQANATVNNSIITKNSATGSVPGWGWGGGIACLNSSGLITLKNCTIAQNTATSYGGGVSRNSSGTTSIKNSIIWNNTASLGGSEIAVGHYSTPSSLSIDFSDVEGGETDVYVHAGSTLNWGNGNIDADPNFVDTDNGDYHLQSQAGRWDTKTQSWVLDEVTSPCIDAGDPTTPIGWEPFPNGGIVNMGAYGGTSEASKTYFGGPQCEKPVAGDINGDCVVNLIDLSIMALHWLEDNRF